MRGLLKLVQYLGVVGVVLIFSKAHAVLNDYDLTNTGRYVWAIAFISIIAVSVYAVGLPDLVTWREAAVASAKGIVLATLTVSVIQLFVGDGLLPRFVVFGSAFTLFPWLLLCATWSARDRARAIERERILVVTEDLNHQMLLEDLRMKPERPAQIVGHMAPDEATPVGTEMPLIEVAKARRASLLVLDRTALSSEAVIRQAALLHQDGVRTRTLIDFYDGWFAKLPLPELERIALMFDVGELHRPAYQRTKRLMDIAIAALGVAPLLLTLPVVAFVNRFVERIPLFYRQERIGRGGRRFDILKYRTMRHGEHGDPHRWAEHQDARVTRFGRILRRSHLDELPQVLNILRGDISVVGPRPEQPHYIEKLTEALPFYPVRTLATPGLTGWAQVKYGYAGNESDALQKLQYDFYYLRHQSIRMDLLVIGRTIRSIVGYGGR